MKDKKYLSDNSALMEEWDYKKNTANGLEPTQLVEGSNKHAWWIFILTFPSIGFAQNVVIDGSQKLQLVRRGMDAKNAEQRKPSKHC